MNQYTERKINEEKFVPSVRAEYIAFDATNQRYIATGNIDSISVINQIDLKCSTFAKNKECRIPRNVCIQPYTDNILVCDSNAGLVNVFNSQKQLTHSINPPCPKYTYPLGIDCDADGTFAVTSYSKEKIKLFAACGKPLRSTIPDEWLKSIRYLNRRFSPSASATLLLACHANGRKISVLSKDTEQKVDTIALDGYPIDICVDLNGYVCVSADHYTGINNELCILEPRKGYTVLQKITLHAPFIQNLGLCVNDLNEIAFGDLYSGRLRFLE